MRTYKQAKERAESIAPTFAGKLKNIVFIKHGDNSKLEFTNSVLYMEQGWVMIFTEHHGIQIYHTEDLQKLWEKNDNDEIKHWI